MTWVTSKPTGLLGKLIDITKQHKENPSKNVWNVLGIDDSPIPVEHQLNVGELLGKPIAGKHNQHVILMIIGKTGEGKSRTGLYVGYKAAVHIAEKLGGTWEDYFGPENIAVMSTDEVIRVIKNNKPKQVIMLDDIGVAWNSRDWQDKGNKILNKIVMTFRNKNNLLILTVPDSFIIDKTPRNLLHFQFEMFQQFFDDGITTYKPFRAVRKYRMGKTHYPYPTKSGVKYTTGITKNSEIPPDLVDGYEKRRSEIQTKMEKDDLEEFESLIAEMEHGEKLSAADIREKTNLDKAFTVFEMKMTKDTSIREGCNMLNLNKDTYYAMKKKYPETFSLSV